MKPNRLHLVTLLASFEDLAGAELELTAAETIELTADGGEADVPKFSMVAYTGGPMRFPHLTPHPVVVDLAGVQPAGPTIPILRDHDRRQRVGHGTAVVESGVIRVEGVMSGAGQAADETRTEARRGFPFQASIGADVLRAEFVKKGRSVEVNGRRFDGPVVIARRTKLNEVSWVTRGRDESTSARIAATKGRNMDFEAWLESLGIEASTLTDERRTAFRNAWRLECGELEVVAAGQAGDRRNTITRDDAREMRETGESMISEIRAEYAAETQRIADIRDLCGDENASIASQAIQAGWDKNRTELELLRRGRASVGIHVRRGSAGEPVNTAVLEAACLMSLGYDDDKTLEAFDDSIIDQANRRFRGMGLRDLAIEAARNDGANVPSVFGDGVAVIEAAVSTQSLNSVVSNVVSKVAHRVYEAHQIVGYRLASVRSVPDYKDVEGWRLDGTSKWEKVGKGGKLESGALDDTQYKNKAELYGQTLGIDYKSFVNDDLGILESIGRLMGFQGASLVDHLVAERLLGNADMDGNTFFSSGNGNLLSGGTSAFGLTGLSKAREAFRKLKAGPGAKAKDKRPIQVPPRILLVPPELETDAENILMSSQLNLTGSTAAEKPSRNPWMNKYELAVMPHLSDSSYTGNSAAAWYLFADPSLVPALEIVLVQGRRMPTIRRVPAPHDSLGLFYQGHFSIGVNFTDPKGAQKSAGS